MSQVRKEEERRLRRQRVHVKTSCAKAVLHNRHLYQARVNSYLMAY